jgi:RNA polymerase sigma-70 factor, ECF subfamily
LKNLRWLLLMGRRGKQNRDVRAQESANPEEIALVASLRAGDEEAFRVLVSRYYGSLLRLAMSFVSERSAAEEVVQETWLGVIHGLSSFAGRSSLKTWIFRILTNRAKTRGKRDARSIPFSSLKDPQSESDYEPAVDPSRFNARGMWADPPQQWTNAAPEDLLLRRETMDLIQRAIAELPSNQRTVVALHDVEGVEPEEICNILEISKTNQRVLLHRARSMIRRALEQHLSKK